MLYLLQLLCNLIRTGSKPIEMCLHMWYNMSIFKGVIKSNEHHTWLLKYFRTVHDQAILIYLLLYIGWDDSSTRTANCYFTLENCQKGRNL